MDNPDLIFLPGVALPLLRGDEHSCPYLPGRDAAELYALAARISSGEYQALMDAGFRRAGRVFYRPDCPGCAACVPIRVPVEGFEPSRSQRRVWRRNADVECTVGPPEIDAERVELYQRYQALRHDDHEAADPDEVARFLYDSPIDTVEFSYRLGGRLVAAGIVDVCPASLSSVYFYFDPDEQRRSLGVYSALCEIGECRRRGLPYWYVGFHVAGCRKLEYKANYRPHELLGGDGAWRTADRPESGS